jgi:hypothetical protein
MVQDQSGTLEGATLKSDLPLPKLAETSLSDFLLQSCAMLHITTINDSLAFATRLIRRRLTNTNN